jgi:DNA-binding transcriptional ArsR family regulator
VTNELCAVHIVNENEVASALRESSDTESLVYLADTFQTLANPTRLLVVEALSKHELCVCDLAVVVGASQSAVSHHLKLLRQMRIVSHRREGRMVYYRLADDHIAQIFDIGLVHVREQ